MNKSWISIDNILIWKTVGGSSESNNRNTNEFELNVIIWIFENKKRRPVRFIHGTKDILCRRQTLFMILFVLALGLPLIWREKKTVFQRRYVSVIQFKKETFFTVWSSRSHDIAGRVTQHNNQWILIDTETKAPTHFTQKNSIFWSTCGISLHHSIQNW